MKLDPSFARFFQLSRQGRPKSGAAAAVLMARLAVLGRRAGDWAKTTWYAPGECQSARSIQSMPIRIHDAGRLADLAGD